MPDFFFVLLSNVKHSKCLFDGFKKELEGVNDGLIIGKAQVQPGHNIPIIFFSACFNTHCYSATYGKFSFGEYPSWKYKRIGKNRIIKKSIPGYMEIYLIIFS